MQKDLKIGILIGFFFATAATIVISTWPSEHLDQRQNAAFQNHAAGAKPSSGIELQQIDAPAESRSQENTLKFGLSEDHPAVAQDDLFSPANDSSSDWPSKPRQRTHTVVKGDTLTSIAWQYYGSSAKWTQIRDANKATLKNPDSLTPGTELIIPD